MKTYTFEVSLPDAGDARRKIEVRADQSLHDLHMAIQSAFEWDADHLYSFFMSGMAWDSESEYTISDEAFDEMIEESEADMDDEEKAELEEAVEWMEKSDDFFEELDPELGPPPTAEEQKQMLQALANMSDEQQAQLSKMLTTEMGMPRLISDMMFGVLRSVDPDMMAPLLNGGLDLDEIFEDEPDAGDSMATAIGSLDLKPDDTFMYLFDYGDEWQFEVRVEAITERAPDDAEYPRLLEAIGEAPEQYPEWDDDEDWDDEDWEDEDEDDEDAD